MIRILMFITLCLFAESAAAQAKELDEVVVTERRPMSEIGVQKTDFDSAALKENVALSMADVLGYNSSVYVKNYGRATLSTVSFRGTSPSHTQVMWNGMRINSPMLGMTDFSMIPSYFIDKASLLHGTSSVGYSGGGLGGAVSLSTGAKVDQGWGVNYVQGVGSFSTFDEYLGLSYGAERWQSSTKVAYASSPNDYRYVNHDKKLNIYDDNHNIVGRYHPVERNRSGSYRDLHVMQEFVHDNLKGDRLSLSGWYVNSDRELPLLTTDYGDATGYENRQREQTFRGVASWSHGREGWKTVLRGGYVHSELGYDYSRQLSDDRWSVMTRSRSYVNTVYGSLSGDYNPSRQVYMTAEVSAHQHFIRSHDKDVIFQNGERTVLGYDKARIELSAVVTAKWQPVSRVGLSAVVRQEVYGSKAVPLIPALFVDGVLSKRGNVTVKASVSKNYRVPTLNDLYFLPGGNPDLRNERGLSYDAGLSFESGCGEDMAIDGSATWFDSRIKDWIMWLPTSKGFFSPRNMGQVHAYGVELRGHFSARFLKDWYLDLSATGGWTPSINRGPALAEGDKSVGKQLPYVPELSSSVVGRLSWKTWGFQYKWCYYSERFTMSSNEFSLSGRLPSYFMSNVALEKSLDTKIAGLNFKLAVNNLFDEDYMSVLSRPMPGINFEFFVSVSPKL